MIYLTLALEMWVFSPVGCLKKKSQKYVHLIQRLFVKQHLRSAQVWHVLSGDLTVLPAHRHVHPQSEWAIPAFVLCSSGYCRPALSRASILTTWRCRRISRQPVRCSVATRREVDCVESVRTASTPCPPRRPTSPSTVCGWTTSTGRRRRSSSSRWPWPATVKVSSADSGKSRAPWSGDQPTVWDWRQKNNF